MKESEINYLIEKLALKGIDRKLSRINLWKCNREFIEELQKKV